MAVDTKASIFQLLASNRERLQSLGVLRTVDYLPTMQAELTKVLAAEKEKEST